MARYKKFLEVDVLQAAKERVGHIFDTFDKVIVMFSGGKDSLVCLHLIKDEAEKRGNKKVTVVFRDEELIPDCVINFVASFRNLDWVDLHWFCYPMMNEKFILGQRIDVVQWGEGREWIRQKPEFAINAPDGNYKPVTQHEMDAIISEPYKGKVAFVTGIRAAESLIRYRSVVNKLNENYICASSTDKVKLAKPIYDWEENDVLKFFHDRQIAYCPIYDFQHLDQSALRVATPLHAEAAKDLGKWRRIDPDFYMRLVRAFPEMQIQERYWHDYDRNKEVNKWDQSWKGCEDFIASKMTGEQARMALDRLREFKTMAVNQPESYTPHQLLKFLSSGNVERTTWGKRTQTPYDERSN